MPELPDITVYVDALSDRILHSTFEAVSFRSPFVLRSVEPMPDEFCGLRVVDVHRIGKRIIIGLEGERWIAIHLMIAGRLQWKEREPSKSGRAGLAEFRFSSGQLTLTEAGSKRRASVVLIAGEHQLRALDPGGLEILSASAAEFTARLGSHNHTLKRSLTDPKIFSGIGNAYSDEILHRARLSPVKLSSKLSADEVRRLFESTCAVLREWSERLHLELDGAWPKKVTAFRPEMAVHGRFGKPCPDCGAPVQRIRYKHNETNYCARCQNEGRLLADRSLSRLLKKDWPRTIDELEK